MTGEILLKGPPLGVQDLAPSSWVSSLMIVSYFDVQGVTSPPGEANMPLVIIQQVLRRGGSEAPLCLCQRGSGHPLYRKQAPNAPHGSC